ncbi:MAG: FAD-dependent oxidoreductase [Tabrizicola sp.]|nr:FAD-dependent oxidoreductase [Tabrizicola sp.]
MTKTIAIIGGGFLGAALAKALDEKAEVTLIEQNSHFVNSSAMIRALVLPKLLDKVLVPYDKLLTRGKVVAARAEGVDATGVTLADGRHIAADYIVVATGSTNAPMFKPTTDGIAGLRAMSAKVSAQIRGADRIAIVGAGAVGTELAGEIAHHLPETKVTLVSGDPTLFPMMPAKLGASLLPQLRALGVEVILGARAENLQSLSEPYSGTLRLTTGQEIAADLIIPAIGSRANSDLLAALPGAEKSTLNRIKTDAWMRPSSLPNVFAAGDAADMGDAMTIVAATRQVPWLTKTLAALIAGKSLESQRPYAPWPKGKTPLLVPLGPRRGASFLVLFSDRGFFTRMIKGKNLFIGKYRKLLRQA